MLSKEYGQTNTFMSIMLMAKITLDMWMWGPFHNTSGVVVNWENVWTNSYAKCTKSCKKNNLFLPINKTQSKRKRPTFLIALGDLFYKVWIVQYYVQKGNSSFTIIKLTVLSKFYFTLFETCFWRYYVIAVI